MQLVSLIVMNVFIPVNTVFQLPEVQQAGFLVCISISSCVICVLTPLQHLALSAQLICREYFASLTSADGYGAFRWRR